jgi:hypothetical protein
MEAVEDDDDKVVLEQMMHKEGHRLPVSAYSQERKCFANAIRNKLIINEWDKDHRPYYEKHACSRRLESELEEIGGWDCIYQKATIIEQKIRKSSNTIHQTIW